MVKYWLEAVYYRFAQALELTRRYQFSDDTLRLLGADATVLARLEAVYLR